uniref:Uncharacterized protein n=2 Tax=Aegilops tauschii subsp. strangulata TaxID=200361 RepID=A0A453KC98_AEGTS
AFLWAPKNYGLSPNEVKEVVHYQTISPKSLADSVLEEGGWSNLVCSKDGPQKNVDVAVLFLGSKLQSSDISKDKQVDPALADILKLSFSSSEFSMAFPYVAMSDDEAFWRTHCYLDLLRIVRMVLEEIISRTQTRVLQAVKV